MPSYKISIHGYGEEIVFGRVDNDIYEYFVKNKIGLDEFIADGEYTKIPKKFWPFRPTSWHDCDDLAHGSGAYMSTGTYIKIEDSSGNTLLKSELDLNKLRKNGFSIEQEYKWDNTAEFTGTIIYCGIATEKGCFFESTISIKNLDYKKFTIKYQSIGATNLLSGIEYDGEELDSDEYSTSGKSISHEFIKISNMNQPPKAHQISEKNLTNWFDQKIKPKHIGIYEIMYANGILGTYFSHWDGNNFLETNDNEVNTVINPNLVKYWRGLNLKNFLYLKTKNLGLS